MIKFEEDSDVTLKSSSDDDEANNLFSTSL